MTEPKTSTPGDLSRWARSVDKESAGENSIMYDTSFDDACSVDSLDFFSTSIPEYESEEWIQETSPGPTHKMSACYQLIVTHRPPIFPKRTVDIKFLLTSTAFLALS